MSIGILLATVLLLAYANGANDNFKGVATLLGSGTADYRRALTWATAATLLGSLAAIILSTALLTRFSGTGLVDEEIAARPAYAAAVALATGATVMAATRLGMPVSTTHALLGALVGAGLGAGAFLGPGLLWQAFFLPLLASPLLALAATGSGYSLLHWARRSLGIVEETCLCVGREVLEVAPAGNVAAAFERAQQLTVRIGDVVSCRMRYRGAVCGVEASALLDRLHFLSAASVSFARGSNDTPKIAALFLLIPQLGGGGLAMGLVGAAMAVGGLVNARRVAQTMSHEITPMNHGQGFTANFMTSAIVIGASLLGLPVSTTHVSCGALFGIGTVTGQSYWGRIVTILAAWVVTLPLGALLGYAAYQCVGWL